MSQNKDDSILAGLDHADESSLAREDIAELKDDLLKTKKQLKKEKKKTKKLKAECKELRQELAQGKCVKPENPPYSSSWVGTIQKSLPEVFKLGTAIVNGSRRYPTRRTKKGDVRYLPPGYPFYPEGED